MTDSRPKATAAGPALIGVAAIAALAAVLRAVRPLLAGPDPFWHWDLGRRIVSDGLPREDPYSFLTGDEVWILNQWGSDALFGLVHAVGGLPLLAIMAALLVGAIYFLVGWRMWQRAPSLVTVGVLGLVYLTGMSNLTLRGNLFTYVLLTFLLAELGRREGPRPVVVLVTMVVWANLHGAFLFGVLLVLAHGTGDVLRATDGRARLSIRWAALAVGSLGVAALSPYGTGLLEQTLRLAANSSGSGISEWGPPLLLTARMLPFTALLGLALLAVALEGRREDLPDLVVVIAFTLLAVTATRNVAPAAIVIGITAAPYITRTSRQLRGRTSDMAQSPVRQADGVMTATLLILGALAVVIVVPKADAIAAHVDRTPVEAIQELKRLDRPVRLFTDAFWAPAASILGGDHVRTAVDGRLELFDAKTLDDYRLVRNARPGWEEQLTLWCVTDVMVAADTPIGDALEGTHGWSEQRIDDDQPSSGPETMTWFAHSSAPDNSCH